MEKFFDYSEEVRHAIINKKPLLALESTVITHGLPYPLNVETALELEKIARDHSVAPATIAMIDGRIKIGVSQEELTWLSSSPGILKASTRDIPYILTKKLSAGTTVAATAHCAHLAGIKVFSTGGIGGVHRGDSMDISADLIELANTPIAIICAGAKAILDLAKTIEFLETYNIPVVGYKTDYLPGFYSRETQYKLNARVDNIAELANMLDVQSQLNIKTSILIVNPISKQDEIPASYIEPVIADAIREAEVKNIKGKALTPFLLREVAHHTKGKSIKANLSLIKNNVKLGAELVYALSINS